MAQWLAHQTSNLGVVGSSPIRVVFFLMLYNILNKLIARFLIYFVNTFVLISVPWVKTDSRKI